MSPELLMQILIPVLIFLARVTDVTIGTMRIISVSRGTRVLAAIFGFFEILIWLLAISQIMHNLNNIVNYIAYAAGFAVGNFVGISIEKRLFAGKLMIRVAVKKDAVALIASLASHGYGVTSLDAQGVTGPVKIIFTVVDRKAVDNVLRIIREYNPNAFYTIEDIRFAAEQRPSSIGPPHTSFLRRFNGSFQKRK
ncbi:MAG: DUF2179 domain-containing protein [Candidatus Omnitrophica bacterium]|nr:DUF2179 domain-containing protein [Candidatus Omnitrophota bacterium]